MAQTSEFYTKSKVDELLGAVDMANIVDGDGNKRFQEWNITNLVNELDITYSKVTLSGSHLMAVVSGRNNTENEISLPVNLFRATLPTWILQKIYAPDGNNTTERDVCTIDLTSFSSLWSEKTTSLAILHITPSENAFIIRPGGTIIIPANSYIRIQVDLIID